MVFVICKMYSPDWRWLVPKVWFVYVTPSNITQQCSKDDSSKNHDDVIKWKQLPRYLPFVRGIHRSPANSLHKGQWRRALMFSLICARIDDWENNHEAGDLRRHRAHYDVNVTWHFLTLTAIKRYTLHWRHNDHDGVSKHHPHGCLLNRLFRHRSKKTSKPRVTGLCAGNSPGPVNSPHKRPVTRKMFPFDDVIMICCVLRKCKVNNCKVSVPISSKNQRHALQNWNTSLLSMALTSPVQGALTQCHEVGV